MQHVLSRDHAPLNLPPLETPCDQARIAGDGEAPYQRPPPRGILILRHWLTWTNAPRQAHQPAPLDDHTLSDIGLTRIEMLYRRP